MLQKINFHKGFSLLEVLVALAIFSIGFLSLAHLQINSLRQAKQALYASVATNQLNNLAEMLSIPKTFLDVNADFQSWLKDTRDYLPNAQAEIQVRDDAYNVTLWSDETKYNILIPRVE